MSDTRWSPQVTTPRSPDGEGGPADTGARWPLPEETFWSEATDPHGVPPGERTAPQPAVRADRPVITAPAAQPQAQPQPKEQAEQPPKRKRDPFLDNVKFVLIALVPLGHSLVPTLSADSSRSLYIFIYTFHMPLFVLISGYLSRNFWNSNAKTNKLVDTFLVPYVIVEVGYAALRFALGQKWSLTIIDPAWLNWYLLALLFWRLSTPVWKRMKYPVPVSIAIYLFAGFSQISGDFSMDRFFGLLPFFVIGLVMQPEHFELLNRRWIKIVSAVTVLGAAAVAIYIAPKAPLGPFYYKNSYQDLDLSWYMGLGLRVGLLVCALAMCFAVLALVPRKETWYTDLGTRTLYCYLLHGIPVLIAKDQGWLDFPWLHGPLGVLAISFSSFALAIVLCLPETRTVFKWVLEPRLIWLYRRPSRS
ncbi:acyltransferase family protein [Nonomuraea sp. B5E05]|uniref:acyltransferase family protein n=1 Tax=Nonomuraea sp. B5E05 TaxID=3153569 RepID=UPI0032601692